ncbi:MAG TPA: hypothetical protein VG168_09460 [Bryobacteraceae bacterium]|nr:hypothetical protein [Bryobacteraceae bacterium]
MIRHLLGGVLFAMALSLCQSRGSAQTVQVVNQTHPGIAPNFIVGDAFTINVSGPPNQAVAVI